MNKFIILIISFLLVIVISYKLLLYTNIKYNFKNIHNLEIIVSRYNEDLKWTLEEPFNKFRYIVYNKGPNDNFEKSLVKKIINLKNVGREGHTYLTHIINNYNNLPDINIFLPGSIDGMKKYIAKELINNILKYKQAIFISAYIYDNKTVFNKFNLNKYLGFGRQNRIINNSDVIQLSRIRPYGKWFENIFSNLKIDTVQWFGIFSLDKRDIISKPINYYQHFLNELQVGSNPEVGHYIERAWSAIFYPLIYTKQIKNNLLFFIIFIFSKILYP